MSVAHWIARVSIMKSILGTGAVVSAKAGQPPSEELRRLRRLSQVLGLI